MLFKLWNLTGCSVIGMHGHKELASGGSSPPARLNGVNSSIEGVLDDLDARGSALHPDHMSIFGALV